MPKNDRIITYEASDTISAFHNSDASRRGIMGPIGSGKSVGCVAEILMKAISMPVGKDGVRKSRWAAVRNCYDDKTELLTENGWKYFIDLLQGEKVAQLSDDGELEFIEPTYYYQKHYTGEMQGFKSEGIDFLVTPDHRMLVSKKRTRKQAWGEYEFLLANEIYNKTGYRVKRDSLWKGEKTNYTVDFFKWLGFWYAEGCSNVYKCADGYTRHQCVITQDPSRFNTEELFKNANLPYSVAKRSDGNCMTYRLPVTEKTKPLIKMLATLGKSFNKHTPKWLKNAPKEHLTAFINGFYMGDGYSKGSSRFLCTSSKQLADDFQEIALRAGMVANVKIKTKAGIKSSTGFNNNYDHYLVTIVTPKKHSPLLQVIKPHCKKEYGWYKEHYNGMVYCIEVPTHKIYVRRNGKAMWCSQTYGELKTTTIKTWQEWVPDEDCPIVYDSPIRGKYSKPLADGTTVEFEIWFIAIDRPDQAKKLLSLELTGVWINEVRELSKSIVDASYSRTSRFPPKTHFSDEYIKECEDKGLDLCYSGLIMDTNPPDDDHWWYRLAEEEKPIGWDFFRQPGALVRKDGWYSPNPLAENVEHLSKGYNYWLDMLSGADPEWLKVHVLGEYGAVFTGKPVFKDIYIDSVHLSAEPLEIYRGLPIFLGWDFGLTPACVIGQLDKNGQLRIVKEIIAEDMDLRRFATNMVKPVLLAEFNGMKIISVGDPAGEQRSQVDSKTCIKELCNLGINTVAAKTNNFYDRRQSVINFLTKRVANDLSGLTIDPSCSMIRKGFLGGYQYERVAVTGEERFKDMPKKDKYSHIMDACQYLALAADGDLIEDVRTQKRKSQNVTFKKQIGWAGYV